MEAIYSIIATIIYIAIVTYLTPDFSRDKE